MKSEVITKAQKIIERLTVKSEADERVMKRLQEENDGHKREALEKQRAIQTMNDQLKEVSAKQTHDHTMMHQTMTKELEEVRHAVREYQVELDTEKSNYLSHVTDLERQLSVLTKEKEDLAVATSEKDTAIETMRKTNESQIKDLQERLDQTSKEKIEIRDLLYKEKTLVEDNAKSQIKYLQTRIKEIVEETNHDETPRSIKTELNDTSTRKGLSVSTSAKKNATGGRSYMQTVKSELEGMCAEVIALREALRDEGNRENAMINQKMSKFDEFRLSVLDQLILWDEKTAELAGLAEQYSGALEEQRKLFNKLKLVVQEKD